MSYSQRAGHDRTRTPPLSPFVNGSQVDTESLFLQRMHTSLLFDIRHGIDTLPERIVVMQQRKSPSGWMKENADLLKALLPYVLIMAFGVLLWLEPQAAKDIVSAAHELAK
jgi:hypothetical protein